LEDQANVIPVGILIDTLYYHVNETITERLRQVGFGEIRPTHGKVFENLAEGRRVSELAQRAQVTKQSMAELVEYLERHEYVARVPDATDRRARIVRLTPRGVAAVAAAEAILEELYEEWRQLLGADRYDTLQQLLQELAAKSWRGSEQSTEPEAAEKLLRA
jgi:DNA-binding MarR family transcriptional regulator